ncbi:MAG: competence/damage-inducible protein A [Candidatus Omnitrophica bacterium]|nr:competence/damage-inducible protein A [Candidatus Omnitrophota bacterium]
MRAEIIAVGTELLLGFVVNTDTVFLGRTLAGLGIGCHRQVTVGDNPRRLEEAIRAALARADLVITCGGLGPTVDDITLETISRATGRRLALNRAILRRIRRRFARLGIRMPSHNARQALIPEGAVVFPNTIGTAPGFLLPLSSSRKRGSPRSRGIPAFAGMTTPKFLAALPGPPKELIPMATRHLIPRLRRMAGGVVILSRTLHLTGLTESEVDGKVRDLLALEGALTLGIYAHAAQVDLRVTARAAGRARARRAIAGVERRIKKRLGPFIYGADDETLEGAVGALLRRRRQTLAVAESCTGGLLGHRVTEAPGSSDYFRGGVVAYANALKEAPLSVPPALLRRHGAVSGPVAEAMAAGVRRLAGSTMGIAVTGIAGPTGGSREKPVGLVYIALATPKGAASRRCRFAGDRSTVKLRASQAALDLVRRYLIGHAEVASSAQILPRDLSRGASSQ